MKTLKTIIAIIIASLFSISCSNDDNSTPEPSKPTYLLTKTNSGSSNTNYTYDDDDKLIVLEQINPASSNYKTAFFYNSNGRLEETFDSSSGGPFPSYRKTKTTNVYDAQNRLIERKFFENSYDFPSAFNYTKSELFEYNTNSIIQKTVLNGNSLPSYRGVFDFNTAGNLVKYTSYSQIDANNPNGLIDTWIVYDYDDKISLEITLPAERAFPFFNKNNIVKMTQTNTSGEVTITNINYEYNPDGYPIKQIVSGRGFVTYEWKKI